MHLELVTYAQAFNAQLCSEQLERVHGILAERYP